jgi:hypothetical protein
VTPQEWSKTAFDPSIPIPNYTVVNPTNKRFRGQWVDGKIVIPPAE